MSETELLKAFTESRSEPAFAQLVRRYANLVYSVAKRRLANASLAEDITQIVFIRLAKAPPRVASHAELAAWLHRITVNVTIDLWRTETRRRNREQQAIAMEPANPENIVWEDIAPDLDAALNQLKDEDRQALVLRFFGEKTMRDVGTALGVGEDAAKMRVSRALDRLRIQMGVGSITCTAAVLATLLTERSVEAVPVRLLSHLATIKLPATPAGAGLAGLLGTILKISRFKLAGGAAVLAVIGAIALHLVGSSKAPVAAVTGARINLTSNLAPSLAGNPVDKLAMVSPVSAANDTVMTSNMLSLVIVAADSGEPVTNVELDYLVWINGKVAPDKTLPATPDGIYNVPVPDGITELRLVSQADGFATTLLDWRPDRGEQIPANYTLKLAAAVSIGGQVVDPDGNPVAGAQVHFEPRPPSPQARPQSDNFPVNYNAITDVRGHWQIDRIGEDAFKTIHGNSAHPDFVNSPFTDFGDNSDAKKQFLAGTYVFALSHAIVVHGVVTGPDGQPVPDANVLIGHGPGDIAARKTKTGSDGTFSVAGCRPGDNLITAAKGYAASSLQVELDDNNSAPFQISLHPGKVLKLRVMDEAGNPVPKAVVMLQFQPDMPDSNDSKPAVPPVWFRQPTDADGRLEWDSAPAPELTFIISAPGYMIQRGVQVSADGIEHVITLQSGLTISGTVTDAATGLPIPHFHIIAGWPESVAARDGTFIEDTNQPHWSTFERDWLAFGGGKFQFNRESPMVINDPDPAYMFKIEAEGYAPFTTRVIHPAEHTVNFDVALTPAAATGVIVYTTNQTAAAGIQIGLVYRGARLILIPGGISTQTVGSGTATAIRITDAQGHFELPPDPAITEIVAASPQGYAKATPKELVADPAIKLAPWGRLEGTLFSNGQPLTGRTLSIGFGQGNSLNTISSGFPNFQAKTDDQGRFSFSQVPTGNHEITIVTSFTNDAGNTGWSEIPLQSATIGTGDTTPVTIDIKNSNLPEFFLRKIETDGTN